MEAGHMVVLCGRCGQSAHPPEQCPQVKAVEYFENGTVKRVEYHEQVIALPHLDPITFGPLDITCLSASLTPPFPVDGDEPGLVRVDAPDGCGGYIVPNDPDIVRLAREALGGGEPDAPHVVGEGK
jgi:hypothetical protein